MGEQIADWVLDAAGILWGMALSWVPETWAFGFVGVIVGYLWGRFGLPGLVSGAVAIAYLLGRGKRKDDEKPDPVPQPKPRKKKTLMDLLKGGR